MLGNLISFALVLHLFVAFWCAGHILLNKSDPRAALGWIMICIFLPYAGPLTYWVFGINRVQRRARRLLDRSLLKSSDVDSPGSDVPDTESELGSKQSIVRFLNISNKVCRMPVTTGNKIEILYNGEQTYPAMLDSIEQASQSVYLMTYIFDTDATGREFIKALSRCKQRGVEVKVLVDGVGELGHWTRASTLLARNGIAVERFLPLSLKPPAFYWNLRNHRKLLIVDQTVAFTGGVNISARHLVKDSKRVTRVEDLHFKLEGPVVSELEAVFYDDWEFVTDENLDPPTIQQLQQGDVPCRVIVDEPSEGLDRLGTTLIGAVSAAEQQVTIMTPYFLPSRELLSALQAAALRNVLVTILLPQNSDNLIVHWATQKLLPQLLQFNIKIYYQPSPFVHTKIFIIDEQLLFFGSANIDPRSLRLNFELNIEAYSRDLVAQLVKYIEEKRCESREYTMNDVNQRTMPIKLRDSVAWLFSPYL